MFLSFSRRDARRCKLRIGRYSLEGHNNVGLHALNPVIRYLVGRVAASFHKAAAADPDNDRNLGCNGLTWGPNVEIEAILALRVRILERSGQEPEDALAEGAILEADVTILRSVDSAVVGGRERRTEA